MNTEVSVTATGKSVSPRLVTFLLALVQFTHIVDFMILMPLGDMLMKEFSIGPARFSFIVSVYTISAGILGFLSAFFIDRFNRKWALVACYAGFGLGTLGCGLVDSYDAFLLFRSIAGGFGGVMAALVLAIVSDLYPVERRGQAMGVLSGAFSAAAVFGVPLGLFLADVMDWHAPFIMLGSSSLVVLLFVLRILPDMKPQPLFPGQKNPTPLKVMSNIFGDSNQVKGLLLTMIVVYSQFIIIPFITPYLLRNVGFEQSQITYVYLVGGGLTVFSAPLVGRLTDRFGRLRVFLTALFLCFIPVIGITHMPRVPVAVALVVTSLFFVLVSSRMIPVQTMVSAVVSPATRASFMSVRSAATQLTAAAASLSVGFIVVESAGGELLHYNWAGYISIAVTLLGFWLAPRLRVAKGN